MRRWALLIVAAVLFSACSGRSGDSKPPADILMEDYTGRSVSDYFTAGPYDLVVLNYWASFCAPCKKEMIDLSSLYDSYRERNVLVLGVATDGAEKKDLVGKIAASLGVTYPILYGAEPLFEGEDIIGYPTTFFIRGGRVVDKIDGARDYGFFSEMVEHHLLSVTDRQAPGEASSGPSRYSLTYTVSEAPEGRILTLELEPAEGYHLNGPGYPPLSVKINTPGNLRVTPEEHTPGGIDSGQKEILEFVLSGTPEENTVITCDLSLIACDADTCSMVNDSIEIKL